MDSPHVYEYIILDKNDRMNPGIFLISRIVRTTHRHQRLVRIHRLREGVQQIAASAGAFAATRLVGFTFLVQRCFYGEVEGQETLCKYIYIYIR